MPDFILKFLHDAVLEDWRKTATPLATVKMLIWLLRLCIDGPPPLGGHTPDGIPYALGPGGECVEFVQESKPLSLGTDSPVGAIVIRRITNEA